MKLLFAPEALEDLDYIYRYYAERNERYVATVHWLFGIVTNLFILLKKIQ